GRSPCRCSVCPPSPAPSPLSLHDALPISSWTLASICTFETTGALGGAAGVRAGAATAGSVPKYFSTSCLARAGSKSPTSATVARSEEHTSELQSPDHLVCRLLPPQKQQKR